MNIRKEILHRGYYANGPFMSVLEEIIEAQTKNPGMICYLQPYDNNVITQLRDLSADKGYTWQFYASTSTHWISHLYVLQKFVISAQKKLHFEKQVVKFWLAALTVNTAIKLGLSAI